MKTRLVTMWKCTRSTSVINELTSGLFKIKKLIVDHFIWELNTGTGFLRLIKKIFVYQFLSAEWMSNPDK